VAGATKIFASVFEDAAENGASETEVPRGRDSGIVLSDRYTEESVPDDIDDDEYLTVSLDEVELIDPLAEVRPRRGRSVGRGRRVGHAPRQASPRRLFRHAEDHPRHAPGAHRAAPEELPTTEEMGTRLGVLLFLTSILVAVSYLTQ
jgi:hypothetical protein